MSIRDERLRRELIYMQDLAKGSSLIDFVVRGNPPDDYLVTFRCLGMTAADRTGSEHVAQIYLHADYPRRAPQVSVLTPCFHPNIAALMQMAPFQARVQQLLAAAPNQEAREQVVQQLSSNEWFYKSHVCLDTLDRNWSTSITLDLICIELGELIQYKRHNVEDPLNHEAAAWTLRNLDRLPVDSRNLLDFKALESIRILSEVAGAHPEVILRIIDEEECRVPCRDR
jgi:ubiquitin-protein ligase